MCICCQVPIGVCTTASDFPQRARSESIGIGQPSTRRSSQRRCMHCRLGSLDGVLVFCLVHARDAQWRLVRMSAASLASRRARIRSIAARDMVL